MKIHKSFLILYAVALICLPSLIGAADFNVSDVASFRQVLIDVTQNAEDDTINVAAGAYDVSGGALIYTPGDTGEGFGDDNHALTILGAGPSSTVLDGGSTSRILYINTQDLSSDSNAHITIRGVTFQNGHGPGNGDGLSCNVGYPDITVENTEFSANTTTGAWIWSTNGIITFKNNTFTDNTAYGEGGGAFAWSNDTIIFTNNVFIGNSAGDGGGAYASSTSTIEFKNNSFDDNSADYGGGAYAHSNMGSITFTNNTFNGNSAEYSGGGLYVWLYENSAAVSMYNNILWGNTSSFPGSDLYVQDDADDNGTGAEVNLFYNDVNNYYLLKGDHLSEGNNMNQPPLLTADFHLQPSSPCINEGIYEKRVWIEPSGPYAYYTYGVPELDRDGDSRESEWVQSESDPDTYYKFCDIGADEYKASSLPAMHLLLLNE